MIGENGIGMADRPVFIATKDELNVIEETVNFEFFNGFALVQKQKSINSLHTAFLKQHPEKKVLEISSKSNNPLGVSLSAFNLKIRNKENEWIPLESVFQGGKIFERGGPYTDILHMPPWDAKKDPRLKENGNIVGFSYDDTFFPTEPKTFFYDWLYVNAVNQNPILKKEILDYDAFTDIEFNPKKSVNCQARSAAIYVSLVSRGLLDTSLSSVDSFKEIVYKGIL